MKSIIKRLKRRAPPTTASAPVFLPSGIQANQPQQEGSIPLSNGQNVQRTEAFFTSPISSSSEIPSQSVSLNSPGAVQQEVPHGEDITISDQHKSLPRTADSLPSARSSSCARSICSHNSSNSEAILSNFTMLPQKPQMPNIEMTSAIRNPSAAKAPSICTFGEKSLVNSHFPSAPASGSDCENGATHEYHDEHYILKPVTRETIHKHVTEEVQKVKIHERHHTYIQHHVQPIIDPEAKVNVHNYSVGIAASPGSGVDRELKDDADLDSVIQEYLKTNRDRYDSGSQENLPVLQSTELPDIERQSTIVHNYHIIQPVIVDSGRILNRSTQIVSHQSKPTTSEVETQSKHFEKINSPQIQQLNKLIDRLQEENHELKNLLVNALSQK